MKVYKVHGWVQYKTDAATPVNHIRLAESQEQAVKEAASHYSSVDYRFSLDADEVGK